MKAARDDARTRQARRQEEDEFQTRDDAYEPSHTASRTDAAGVDRYGCEIIAEKVDFLSRPRTADGEGPELVDRDRNEEALLSSSHNLARRGIPPDLSLSRAGP